MSAINEMNIFMVTFAYKKDFIPAITVYYAIFDCNGMEFIITESSIY